MNENALPNLLLIGAMKAGTTTLYRDLLSSPDVYLPVEKEPGCLKTDEVLSDGGTQRYARQYRRGKTFPIRADATTDYSKLPDVSGVPRRARRLLGSDCRIIYLCRHPVDRAVSHYNHDYISGLVGANINGRILQSPPYLNYSRYSMQLDPWLQEFDLSRVQVLQFEEYVRSRQTTVDAVCEFLEIRSPELRDEETNYNQTAGSPIIRGRWREFRETQLYQKLLRPLMPVELRRRVRESVLPRADLSTRDDLTEETVHQLWAHLQSEGESLSRLVGKEFFWEAPDVGRMSH